MTDLLAYLQNRRSSVSMTIEAPGPSDRQIETMLRIASRVPDHGKLAPWRFELWQPQFRARLHRELTGLIDDAEPDAAKKSAGTDKLLHAPCFIAVISTANESEKVPLWEQHLSAGAACMLLLEAANALGFVAQWLTAWYVYDERAMPHLGLAANERIAGLVHIGSSTVTPTERPRPDLADIFTIREG